MRRPPTSVAINPLSLDDNTSDPATPSPTAATLQETDLDQVPAGGAMLQPPQPPSRAIRNAPQNSITS